MRTTTGPSPSLMAFSPSGSQENIGPFRMFPELPVGKWTGWNDLLARGAKIADGASDEGAGDASATMPWRRFGMVDGDNARRLLEEGQLRLRAVGEIIDVAAALRRSFDPYGFRVH